MAASENTSLRIALSGSNNGVHFTTLFLIFRQKNIDIWKQKIDWIAQNGGMVLLNVHPDYLNFGPTQNHQQFDYTHYQNLLQYLKTQYRDQYWLALPREMSAFAASKLQTSINGDAITYPPKNSASKTKSQRICVIRHGRYPEDPRVRKEVDALLSAGHEVDVLCLKQDENGKKIHQEGKLTVIRIPIRHKRRSLIRYFWEYGAAFLIFAFLVSKRHISRRYDFVQINTMPDALVFCSLVPRLLGAKIVLDVHEPTPELWHTKYGSKFGILYAAQVNILKAALLYAHQIITVSIAMKDRLSQHAGQPLKITVIPNVTNLSFGNHIPPPTRSNHHDFILVTHGLIEDRYGHELVIKAVQKLSLQIPNIHYNIIGEGENLPHLKKLVNELNCSKYVSFLGFLPFDELVKCLKESHVGIIPMRLSPYSELIDTNKMYEYMVLGIPVIHSRLPVVTKSFTDDEIEFFNPDDVDDLYRALFELYQNPSRREYLQTNAMKAVSDISWEKTTSKYLQLFAS